MQPKLNASAASRIGLLVILVLTAFILMGVLGWLVYLGKAPAQTLVSDIQDGLTVIAGIISAFHLTTFFRLQATPDAPETADVTPQPTGYQPK